MDQRLIAEERTAALHRAIAALSQERQTVIMLRFLRGHTYDEIARITGTPKRAENPNARPAIEARQHALAARRYTGPDSGHQQGADCAVDRGKERTPR